MQKTINRNEGKAHHHHPQVLAANNIWGEAGVKILDKNTVKVMPKEWKCYISFPLTFSSAVKK